MEQAVVRENAREAFKRVRRNKGSPGIDGMTVGQLEPYLREHWSRIREQLLAGTYQPSVVKRQEILEELKHRVRQITRRSGGGSLEQVAGELRSWKTYFQLAETPQLFRDLDGWIHRRLRALQLKQWKRGRTTVRELRARGVPDWLAQRGRGHGNRWWWASALGAIQTALPGSYFDRLGVPRLAP